jgi:hypothetical protein
MPMPMKYIVVRTTHGEEPIMFSGNFMHADLAQRLAQFEIVAAGFVRLTAGGIECFGSSVGLHIPSRGTEDAILFANGLQAPPAS